ncbi:MAG: lytic transglycosylase domain-containing protein [Syntrophobacterales bacterium]|jgi:soluble lytic murein transglycosylase-like protein|nr:lytic transglycosylase domain-containing protein [Syntrophobacterales bacterium]
MFSQILRKMTADASQSHDVPLDKEMIQQMIQWLNIKMNERLIQSVSTDGLNSPQKENWELFLSRYAAGMESNKKEEQISPAVVEPERKRYSSFASIERFVQKAAAAHDVDPGLIRSVIQVESNFDASARSPKGAMGLMQLMPGTAKELGVNDPYDPEENIMGGTRYLKKLLNRYNGDVSLALAAYNWGMGNLESRPARMPEETKNYIKQVTKLYGMDNKEIL